VRVIGVVDLLADAPCTRAPDDGRVTSRCAPSPARPSEPGDGLALAGAYVDRLGIAELYAADLDAILDGLRDESDASGRVSLTLLTMIVPERKRDRVAAHTRR